MRSHLCSKSMLFSFISMEGAILSMSMIDAVLKSSLYYCWLIATKASSWLTWSLSLRFLSSRFYRFKRLSWSLSIWEDVCDCSKKEFYWSIVLFPVA
jgi:hypothetical protein